MDRDISRSYGPSLPVTGDDYAALAREAPKPVRLRVAESRARAEAEGMARVEVTVPARFAPLVRLVAGALTHPNSEVVFRCVSLLTVLQDLMGRRPRGARRRRRSCGGSGGGHDVAA